MQDRDLRVVELSGGVGGARLAAGLDRVPEIDLTVVVNVGDDEVFHGLHVSADLDTVIYTMAGQQGDHGWGRSHDSFVVNEELGRFGMDNRFRLGDLDLALNLTRTTMLSKGRSLSEVTAHLAASFGITSRLLPATEDRLRTEVYVEGEGWLSFQDYFVIRGNRDTVTEIRFSGADHASASPGVVEAIAAADMVVVAPSNPPLSIWPILAIDLIRSAVSEHPKVVAVSPLFDGKALKGPTDRVMRSLGLPPGNQGVAAAYAGVIDELVVDVGDAGDAGLIDIPTRTLDTRIGDPDAAGRFARRLLFP